MDTNLKNIAVTDLVRISYPFQETFPDTYSVQEITVSDDNQLVYRLEGAGNFDIKYLEKI